MDPQNLVGDSSDGGSWHSLHGDDFEEDYDDDSEASEAEESWEATSLNINDVKVHFNAVDGMIQPDFMEEIKYIKNNISWRK